MTLISRIVAFLALMLLLSCGGSEEPFEEAKDHTGADARSHVLSTTSSDTVMDVQLPFFDGDKYICTQNSWGDTSHQGGDTKYDLDFGMPKGSIVVAAANGIMRRGSNPGGFGTYAKVEHANGRWTMYAHLSGFIASDGQPVVAGQPIAYSGNTGFSVGSGGGYHLHFGVHTGSGNGTSQPMRVYAHNRNTGVTGYFRTGDPGGSTFVCGLTTGHTYEARPIGQTFSDYQCRKLSDGTVLCWQGNPVDCVDGSNHVWYRKNSEGAFTSSPVDKHQKCPLSTGQSANIFSYLEGGYGVGGSGPGGSMDPTDPPAEELRPDFIVESLKLYLAGSENYGPHLQTAELLAHARICNIGDANWAGDRDDMYVRLYLSDGTKLDPPDERRLVGTQQIKRGNIDAGTCKDEYFALNLATVNNGSPVTPGTRNLVAWVDRKDNEDDGDGEVPEKHKSNNRSTELVFEVTLDPSVPRPDFVVHGLTFLQAPTYAADPARLGGYIRNAGAARPWSGIRSQYSVECPGTGRIPLTDDGTDADQLDPGESAYESNQSLVYMPNVAGQCTVYLCADHADEVLESDETNNCQAIPITLQPRPAAKLVITSFADENNCCTTNTGERLFPRVWVRNDGNAAPASPYPPVIYHIASPVATGGRYIHMGNGSLRQTDLAPGATDDDKMDGNGWIIPKNNAWKGYWHTIRACIRADGGQPVGDETTEVCRVYQHKSKK